MESSLDELKNSKDWREEKIISFLLDENKKTILELYNSSNYNLNR